MSGGCGHRRCIVDGTEAPTPFDRCGCQEALESAHSRGTLGDMVLRRILGALDGAKAARRELARARSSAAAQRHYSAAAMGDK